jgi:hypothetical protein
MANAGALNCTSTVLSYALATDEPVNGPVRIKAGAANSGNIFLGDNTVTKTANGYELAKGEAIDIPYVVNLNQLYAACATANDDVYWIKLEWQ